MTAYYGWNPSGGVHRYDDITAVLEVFVPDPDRWEPVADPARYSGWIDWASLGDMPAEVQVLEGAAP